MKLLRDKLHRYITNRENAERTCGIKDGSKDNIRNVLSTSQDNEPKVLLKHCSLVPPEYLLLPKIRKSEKERSVKVSISM